MPDITRVGVLGCGLMGSGIAQAAATAGIPTVVRDVEQGLLARGEGAIAKSLGRLVEKSKLDPAGRDAALHHLSFTTRLDDLASCDLIIEAVTEDLALKTQLWGALDPQSPAATIFASNTSSLSIGDMAAATGRPDRFIGLHFFNPVPLMALLELIRGLQTSDDTHAKAEAFAKRIGKVSITAKNSPGFAVNRILCPMINEAIFALQEGIATAEDLDAGMKLGCNHPIGPLALADMIGLDTMLSVMEVFYEGFNDPKYRPAPLLKEMVAAGHLGRKTGQGFYSYGK